MIYWFYLGNVIQTLTKNWVLNEKLLWLMSQNVQWKNGQYFQIKCVFKTQAWPQHTTSHYNLQRHIGVSEYIKARNYKLWLGTQDYVSMTNVNIILMKIHMA